MCLAAPSGWELPSVLCGPAGLGLAPGGPSSPAEAACCALSWVQELCCQRGPQIALSSQRRLSDGDTPVYPVFTQEASGPGRLDNSPKVIQGTEEAEPSWSAVAEPPPPGEPHGLGRGCSPWPWVPGRVLGGWSRGSGLAWGPGHPFCSMQGVPQTPRGPSSHLRHPLKPCAPGWPLHPLWRWVGGSPRSLRASHGVQPDGTRQITEAPAELTVFWEMLLKPADCAGGWGVFLEAVGFSGHPSPLPLGPDSPTWPELASRPPCSPLSPMGFSVLKEPGGHLGRRAQTSRAGRAPAGAQRVLCAR